MKFEDVRETSNDDARTGGVVHLCISGSPHVMLILGYAAERVKFAKWVEGGFRRVDLRRN